MTALYQPLLQALRTNLDPAALAGFLTYASTECGTDFELPSPDMSEWQPPTWEPFAPGELPEVLPGAPEVGENPTAQPENEPAPSIGPDSETAEVAAWCREAALNASVVGQWVWCDPYQQLGRDRAALDRLLRAAGFKFSSRRQSYFHACGVSCRRQPGDKRRGGKLERFHGTASVADYNPKTFDPRPGWQLAKAAKTKARRKRA